MLMPILSAAPTGPPAPAPQVVVAWDFSKGAQGWEAQRTTAPRVIGGRLTFRVMDGDALLVGPSIDLSTSPNDVLEVRLRAPAGGSFQWFWRSDRSGPFGGFSAERSATFVLEPRPAERTVRVRPGWHASPRIEGIRFDVPEDRPGDYAIRSIRILRAPPGAPVRPEFDFASGAAGWTGDDGMPAVAGRAGLALRGDGGPVQSPALDLPPERPRYVVIDATAPTSARRSAPVILSMGLRDATGRETARVAVQLRPSARSTVSVALPQHGAAPATLSLYAGNAGQAVLTVHALRLAMEPAPGDGARTPTGLELQTQPWSREYRLPIAPQRIDVAREAPPATRPVGSDYTVAMWYFAAWEPEYTWDGWGQLAERSPWRIPLLYDSADPGMDYSGIRYYRASNPRVVDWHVHWLREHAVNLMIWLWYPHVGADGRLDPGFFANRALETAFLGKAAVGGPPVVTNRFADTMPFAIMWTNHPPAHRLGEGLVEYIVEQYFVQPNYYRIDGKPFLSLWSAGDLISAAGGEAQARGLLDRLRATARARGHAGVYIAAVHGVASRAQAERLGIDGVMGYNYLGSGGVRVATRLVGERTIRDQVEDFASQTIPGHEAMWRTRSSAFGRDYLLATTPMQNWEPALREGSPVMIDHTPDIYRELLRRAKAAIAERGLRRFVTIQAFNEWLEGSYVEPSTQWGMTYLEAIRDVFGAPAQGAPR
ncbi:MAG TPA: glycoside hydrolase family 99-like domain-containing protein [Chthonomonadales bacterium]|nr:glycoside hydrolase family 99-like domain-containing protein [Chthonomonadales bacterium]